MKAIKMMPIHEELVTMMILKRKTLDITVMMIMIIVNIVMINMRMESRDSVDFLFSAVTQNWRHWYW